MNAKSERMKEARQCSTLETDLGNNDQLSGKF